jgi:hypothetical protein
MDLDDDKAGWEAEREAEFETSMVAGADIWGWEELWKQIKKDLAGSKTHLLPLSQINQLIILQPSV